MAGLSARASGLYTQSSVTMGFALTRALAPDCLPHCPSVFLRSSVCLQPFRVGPLRDQPGCSATVHVTNSRRGPFTPIGQPPAGHTSAARGLAALGVEAVEEGVELGNGEGARAGARKRRLGGQVNPVGQLFRPRPRDSLQKRRLRSRSSFWRSGFPPSYCSMGLPRLTALRKRANSAPLFRGQAVQRAGSR